MAYKSTLAAYQPKEGDHTMPADTSNCQAYYDAAGQLNEHEALALLAGLVDIRGIAIILAMLATIMAIKEDKTQAQGSKLEEGQTFTVCNCRGPHSSQGCAGGVLMKGPQGRRGQQKARQFAAGEGQPSPHWLASLTNYQLRGFVLTGTPEEKGPFLAELARRGKEQRRTDHAPDCAGAKADYCSCGLYFPEDQS